MMQKKGLSYKCFDTGFLAAQGLPGATNENIGMPIHTKLPGACYRILRNLF